MTTAIINEPWVEKYRPNDINTIISHDRIKNHIKKYIDQGALPNLLFHGPAGVGKTTLIKSIARQLYGDKYSVHVIEINASDENGVEVIRERVNNFVHAESLLQANKGPNIPKLIILDECDQMSSVAQGALRRIIELASARARFCLICNQVSKIIPPLQSRCTVFRFKLVQPEDMKMGLQRIIDAENLQITQDALETLIKVVDGDMRQSVNLLQAVWMSARDENQGKNDNKQYVIQKQDVLKVSGKPDENVCDLFVQPQTFQDRHKQLKDIIDSGVSLEDLIQVLISTVLSNVDYDELQRRFLLKKLGEIDESLQLGADLQSQLAGIIYAFTEVQK